MKNFVNTDRILFLYFPSLRPGILNSIFDKMGFIKLGVYSKNPISLCGQGHIRFICNQCNSGNADIFRAVVGRGVSAPAFTVENSRDAFRKAIELGLPPVEIKNNDTPGINGLLYMWSYLVDELCQQGFFAFLSDHSTSCLESNGSCSIDHVNQNLKVRETKKWRSLCENMFWFRGVITSNITGQLAGFISNVVTSPNGKITISLNGVNDDKLQIAEFLQKYTGRGYGLLLY
ncbi:MAG: hypothetical protein HRU20_25400 [Pseudomonadales bacterium]|nr:hypothetical protein [Pseudomonadales bacterium]